MRNQDCRNFIIHGQWLLWEYSNVLMTYSVSYCSYNHIMWWCVLSTCCRVAKIPLWSCGSCPRAGVSSLTLELGWLENRSTALRPSSTTLKTTVVALCQFELLVFADMTFLILCVTLTAAGFAITHPCVSYIYITGHDEVLEFPLLKAAETTFQWRGIQCASCTYAPPCQKNT